MWRGVRVGVGMGVTGGLVGGLAGRCPLCLTLTLNPAATSWAQHGLNTIQ